MDDAAKLADLAIADIMTPNVVTTTAVTPVEDVARELRLHGFGGLPIVDEDGILIGIVSEFDVISKRGRTAEEIMTRDVISVSDETNADQVTSLMGLHGIRRVPVLRNGRLVGIVSRSDLLRLFSAVRWACETCGDYERGFVRPETCVRCGGTDFHLEHEDRAG